MSFCGMPLYILGMCPENRDESNGNNIVRLWLQFIPILGALHSQLRKGHTTKRHLHVPHMHRISVKGHEKKKTSPCSTSCFHEQLQGLVSELGANEEMS